MCASFCSVVVCLFAAEPLFAAAALTPDGAALVVASQRGVEVRDWPSLSLARSLSTPLETVHDLAFAPGGRMLLAAGGAPGDLGETAILSWPAGAVVHRRTDHRDVVYRAAWSAAGDLFATAGADGVCRLYRAADAAPLAAFQRHSRPVLATTFAHDGGVVVSAGVDQALHCWSARDARPIRAMENHVGAVFDLVGRPNSPVVVSAGADKTVRLWRPDQGRLVRFRRLDAVPRALAFGSSGDRLLVGCDDGAVRILDADSLEPIGLRKALDGRILAVVVDGQSRVLAAGAGLKIVKFD